jgi:hypothetical protein
VRDHLDGAEPLADGRDAGGQLRIGTGKGDQIAGGAELAYESGLVTPGA